MAIRGTPWRLSMGSSTVISLLSPLLLSAGLFLMAPSPEVAEVTSTYFAIRVLSAPMALANYTLLGAIVETITGSSYPDALTRFVTDPLGLDATTGDPQRARAAGAVFPARRPLCPEAAERVLADRENGVRLCGAARF